MTGRAKKSARSLRLKGSLEPQGRVESPVTGEMVSPAATEAAFPAMPVEDDEDQEEEE